MYLTNLHIFLENMRQTIKKNPFSVADPGFPVGGGGRPRWRRQPLTWSLFGANVCMLNKRIGSRWGAGDWGAPGSATGCEF